MKRSLTAFAVVWLVASSVFAADFYPISSVSSSTAASDLFPVANLIQGPGVGIAATEPHDKILGGAEGNWVTTACGFPCDYISTTGTPTLLFDLGTDQLLGEISVWGYTSTNANGVSQFSLKFATSAEGPGGLGTSIAYNPSFSMDVADIPRQSKPFGQNVTARYVELTALDNYFTAPGDGSNGTLPGGDRVGLGEVAFAVVPEPSSLCLFGLGLLPIVRRRR